MHEEGNILKATSHSASIRMIPSDVLGYLYVDFHSKVVLEDEARAAGPGIDNKIKRVSRER